MLNCLLEGNYGTGSIIVDVLCVVILLLFAIICTSQGFVKQVFGIFSGIGAIVFASLVCGDLFKMTDKWWGLSGKLAASLNNGLFKDFKLVSLSETGIQEAINKLGLPDFLGTFAIEQLQNLQTDFSSVGAYLSQLLAKYILLTVTFIIVFIITVILLRLLKKILMKIVKLPVIHSIDRILGTLLGIIKGVLFLYAIVYLAGVVFAGMSASDADIAVFALQALNAMNGSYIVSFMMEYNIVAMLFHLILANIFK